MLKCPQQILVCDVTTTKVKLEFDLAWRVLSRVCSLMSWIAALLSNSLSWMFANMSTHQDQNMSSASAAYPPCNLVILGSHICQNSLDACATAAAKTSATMVAASWALPMLAGGMPLTSKVRFNGTWLDPRNGVDEYGGKWFVGGTPDPATFDSRSGQLDLSPNRTYFWNWNGWSGEL